VTHDPRPEIEAALRARTLLGRVTTLADVGNAAAYLASDQPPQRPESSST
jgi:hypothetical protein